VVTILDIIYAISTLKTSVNAYKNNFICFSDKDEYVYKG
jgi:hypothetical protein